MHPKITRWGHNRFSASLLLTLLLISAATTFASRPAQANPAAEAKFKDTRSFKVCNPGAQQVCWEIRKVEDGFEQSWSGGLRPFKEKLTAAKGLEILSGLKLSHIQAVTNPEQCGVSLDVFWQREKTQYGQVCALMRSPTEWEYWQRLFRSKGPAQL